MTTAAQNTVPETKAVAIGGYSPVSFFEKGHAELGSPDHVIEHDGKVYHLASADQAKAFRANPDKYLPAHGGVCAYGVSIGETFPVDPTNFKIVDDRLLLFLKNDEVDARELWDKEHGQQCSTNPDSCCSS
jgi:YHS domain-containing protein